MVRSSLRALGLIAMTTFTLLSPVAAPASAAATANRADAAAGWLAGQMVSGQRFEVVFDGVTYPDQGLTIDAVFAFAATRTGRDHALSAMGWLAQPEVLTGYIGDGVEAYAGSTTKLALAVEVTGADPTSYGGVDLITRLRGLQSSSGRFTDRSAYGDYTNAFSQSFALLALDRTAAGAPAAAVAYLAAAQCADGGFPLLFEQSTCDSDADATSMAVQALLATGDYADAQEGLTWLVSHQQAGGGFAAYGVVNANSTGLAAAALLSGGRLLADAQARVFLRGLQQACAAPVQDRGAFAYTSGGFDPALAPRATAQAVLGLAGRGYAHLSLTGASADTPTLACS